MPRRRKTKKSLLASALLTPITIPAKMTTGILKLGLFSAIVVGGAILPKQKNSRTNRYKYW